MNTLSKKHNITVGFQNMPNAILGVYVEIFKKPYILLNTMLNANMHEFIFYACLYFQENEKVGKITVNDLENKNYKPFIYAREKMRDKLVC